MIKQKGRVSLFIGFTPYHAYVVSRILDQCEGPVYCCFSKLWPNSSRRYTRLGFARDRMESLAGGLSFLVFAFFVRWLKIRRIALDVYMPHPGNIFTNYLFLSARGGCRVYIYEDGILNYYDAVQRNTFVGFGKRLLSWLGLMPYRPYKGHLAGYDAGCYDGAFLSMPTLAVRRDSLGIVRALPVPAKSLSVDPHLVLFLDQNVSAFLDGVQRQSCVDEMFRLYPLAEFRYVYKPHHDFCSEISHEMSRLSAAEAALPAELLVEKICPGHVVSFFSSALINIRNVFPGISCVSLASSMVPISRGGHQEPLSKLFAQVGVECLGAGEQ